MGQKPEKPEKNDIANSNNEPAINSPYQPVILDNTTEIIEEVKKKKRLISN